MKAALAQLVRYAIVGLLSNAAGYLIYLALTALGTEPKSTMSFVYLLGVIQTFFFNKQWSFRHDGLQAPAFARYVAAYLFGYLLNLLTLWWAVDHLGWPHQWVQAGAVVGIAVTLFLLQRYWVFAPAHGRLT